MKVFLFAVLLLLSACASKVDPGPGPALDITEGHPDKFTAFTRRNLLHLTQVYDLNPFLFTRTIHVDPKERPHAVPVLTLNTRYAETPNKLLSALLHEEFHLWVDARPKETASAMQTMKKVFPKQIDSIYLHLIVCFLEYKALAFYLGDSEARAVIHSFMIQDKLHIWVFSQVLTNTLTLERILDQKKLIPDILR